MDEPDAQWANAEQTDIRLIVPGRGAYAVKPGDPRLEGLTVRPYAAPVAAIPVPPDDPLPPAEEAQG